MKRKEFLEKLNKERGYPAKKHKHKKKIKKDK